MSDRPDQAVAFCRPPAPRVSPNSARPLRTHARLTARPLPQTNDRDAGPPLEINANLYDPIPPTTTAKLVRLTNVVGVETEPFDPETYQPQEDTFVDNEGKTRISTPFTNIIRWRKVIDPETGEEKVQSNARMVKWSDGSWQLLIGDEAFNVTETDLGDRNEYLFARHPGAGLIQGQKRISSKLAFTPANLDSATHRRLTRAIDTRHVKTKQTQKFIAVTDPEREKAAADAEAERVMKEQDAAKKRQSAAMGGGPYATPSCPRWPEATGFMPEPRRARRAGGRSRRGRNH